MTALPPHLPPVRHPRVRCPWWSSLAAGLALSALVLATFARRGTSGSNPEGRALAPDAALAASGSVTALRAGALDRAEESPVPATTVGSESDATRKARVAAEVPPVGTIVLGFEVSDEILGQPLDAWRAATDFELTRGDEQWSGRRLRHEQRWFDAQVAFGNDRQDSPWGANEFLYVELDPDTPSGVPLEFALELTFEAETERGVELLPRATYRAQGTLTLGGAPYQRLPDVPCRRVDAWAAGVVVAGPHIALAEARVELIEAPVNPATGVVDEEHDAPGAAAANAPVRADGSFSVSAPARPTLSHLRLRVVLADGRSFPHSGVYPSFTSGISLQCEASRTATGRLLFRGAPATGLARLHVERGGARVGHVSVERDGTFVLSDVPYGAFDVVIESGRPGGELARFPLASLTGDVGAGTLDIGVIEVAGHAEVMELELVDQHGAPAAAHLRWRGRGGSGGVPLRAAALHTLLLAPIVPFDMELVAAPQTEPIALAAQPGRVRVVVGE